MTEVYVLYFADTEEIAGVYTDLKELYDCLYREFEEVQQWSKTELIKFTKDFNILGISGLEKYGFYVIRAYLNDYVQYPWG